MENLSPARHFKDLFMGTGLGPETYALIEQGRIGQFSAAVPPIAGDDSRKKCRHTKFEKPRSVLRSSRWEDAKSEPGAA